MDILAKAISRLPRSVVRKIASSQFRSPWLKRWYDWTSARYRNRDATIASGVGEGLKFNPCGTNAGYTLGTNDPEVQTALAAFLRPGNVFYDVGANVGFLSVLASRLVGPQGRVFSFEPLEANVRALRHNLSLNGREDVTVSPVAVGARDGVARFLLMPISTLSKLAEYRKDGDPVVGEVEVPLRRIDTLRAEGEFPPPDLVKIDVEGAEVDVLSGAADTLRATGPLLMIELHGTNEGVAGKLDELGYRGFPLGGGESIVAAPWYAIIVAAPADRPDLVERVKGVAKAAHAYR